MQELDINQLPEKRKKGLLKAFRNCNGQHSTVVLIYEYYIILDHLIGEAVIDTQRINIITGKIESAEAEGISE